MTEVLGAGQHYRLEGIGNSFSNGGARGVSDAFAASLWGVDYMYWWAAHSASGLNFNTSGPHETMQYAVFAARPDGCHTHPLGYALKAFDVGCHGRLVAAKANPPVENLGAWAVRTANGALFVTLVNKEYAAGACPLEVTLEGGSRDSTAAVMFLTAAGQGVEATSGITLGGSPIQDDGSWNGQWTGLTPEAGSGNFVIDLPPASVAVVGLNGK